MSGRAVHYRGRNDRTDTVVPSPAGHWSGYGSNQVAIVTGAASGIGRAIARRFARAGARVAVTDLDAAAAVATAREIDADPARAIGFAMDVTDEGAVASGVAEVVAKYGGVDILVSNAGIQIVRPLEQLTYAEWKRMLAIHLDGLS